MRLLWKKGTSDMGICEPDEVISGGGIEGMGEKQEERTVRK